MERRFAEGSLKQWLPNGKLLLLSRTKCHGVPCSLPSRIATKVLKNCKTETKTKCSRLRPRLSFLSSMHLETKTLVSRTTSLPTVKFLYDRIIIMTDVQKKAENSLEIEYTVLLNTLTMKQLTMSLYLISDSVMRWHDTG